MNRYRTIVGIAATRQFGVKCSRFLSGHQVIDEQPTAVADLLERYAGRQRPSLVAPAMPASVVAHCARSETSRPA